MGILDDLAATPERDEVMVKFSFMAMIDEEFGRFFPNRYRLGRVSSSYAAHSHKILVEIDDINWHDTIYFNDYTTAGEFRNIVQEVLLEALEVLFKQDG